jgi:transposase
MLIEGQCEGFGAMDAAVKYGLSRPRYYQLLKLFHEQGTTGLRSQKRGPKGPSVRTEEVVRQVIRHRFLDPDASTDVIAQKLRQTGYAVSTRSVERIIEQAGLQKLYRYRPGKPQTLPTLAKTRTAVVPCDPRSLGAASVNSWPTR